MHIMLPVMQFLRDSRANAARCAKNQILPHVTICSKSYCCVVAPTRRDHVSEKLGFSEMVQVVWFKRDLRVQDHAPLAAAAANAGPVLPLLIVEPQYWAQPDMAARHYAFWRENADSLAASLERIGLQLIVRVGAAVDVLAAIHGQTSITALHSHMETGNAWTFERDKLVGAWCAANDVPWHQPRQFGVVRPFNNRNRWASQWEDFMTAPTVDAPTEASMAKGFDSEPLPDAHGL
ncbi:MAG: deoxyribodipyrimidine photo-lyase, partial [Pseudomonadota bacterium]